jgi:hypothetical protein
MTRIAFYFSDTTMKFGSKSRATEDYDSQENVCTRGGENNLYYNPNLKYRSNTSGK